MCKCLNCTIDIPKNRKYCSIKCQKDFEYNQKILNWDNDYPGWRVTRRWLIETYGYKCYVCGISEWRGNPLILDVEHKDGNSENHTQQNLGFICPNCHSQTPTYKAKNKGNGRHKRMQRYYDGKSY